MNLEKTTILETPKEPETLEQEISRLKSENEILREANDQLIKQVESFSEKAYIDELTGLGNRNSLKSDIDLVFNYKPEGIPERRKEGQENNICVIMIDIDYFKKVNDTYGHRAGDEILRKISEKLESSIRSSDLIYRYGGEEILIMLTEASEYEAGKKAERLRKIIENESFDFNGEIIPVTISVGVTFGDKNSDPDKLIEEADKALYASKNSGRNKVTAFSNTSKQ